MTSDEIISVLFNNRDEFLEFNRVEHKRSNRPDLHAFLLLDELVPEAQDIIVAAEHDQIWLSVSVDDLVTAGVTQEQVIELTRCGILYDTDVEALSLFV